MNTTTRSQQGNVTLGIALLIYLVLGAMLLPYYRYQINPDGISYISSASKYLRGEFDSATTGHWSPLFSLLLVPWLYLGVDGLLASKLLTLAIGALTLLAIQQVSLRFHLSNEIRITILGTSIPVIVSFALGQITPDPLQTCILLFYFAIIFDRRYTNRLTYGVWCGILGGIGYLAKHYSLPFFLGHFPLMNIVHYYQTPAAESKKAVVRNFLVGIVLCSLISSPYIAAISTKYGGLMFSTTGAANYLSMSPKPPQRQLNYFIEPPDKTAVSIWEDPYSFFSSFSYHVPWSPFESYATFKHLLKIVAANALQAITLVIVFSPLACVINLIYLILLFLHTERPRSKIDMLFPWLTMFLFASGYCFARIGLEERYIMVICFLLMVTSGYILTKCFQHPFFTKTKKIILLSLFITSFAISPLQNLRHSFNSGKALYQVSQTLKGYIPPGAKLASTGYWYESLYLAYHLSSQIYGTTEHMTAEEATREMERYQITHFMVWDDHGGTINFVGAFNPIVQERYENHTLTVYTRQYPPSP